MKITHLILTRNFAGSERYAMELANLQSRTHDVSMIISPQAAESRPDALLHRLDPSVKVFVLRNKLRFLQIYEARRLLRNINPDIAHGHLNRACRALSGYAGASKRVATLHIHYKRQQHEKLDGLIAIAQWQLAGIPGKLLGHTAQIDNWTADNPAGAGKGQAMRAQYGIKPTDILVGALGRTVDSKGFDTLIKAFRQADIPNARLAIVGSGKAWKKLEAMAGPDIIMPGFCATPADWLAAFDVFVSSARSEPFGLVFLEAMDSGLPILATASQGALHLHHLIQTPLIPIDDADSMRMALESFCSRSVERRQYDLSRYRIEPKALEIEAFYRSLMT
jgi:glycosyltransferase involved in cell wall biosynthesis